MTNKICIRTLSACAFFQIVINSIWTIQHIYFERGRERIYFKAMFFNQISGKMFFFFFIYLFFHKVVEKPCLEIVNLRGFGPMENFIFEDFQGRSSPIGFATRLLLRICTPKRIFLCQCIDIDVKSILRSPCS